MQDFLWFKRFISYGLSYYLLEKPRGLDFSKRSRDKKSDPSSSGYALTSKYALRNILKGTIIKEDSTFIDIGGGKAATAFYSLSLGFKKSASLEFEDYLHKIAKKNISILRCNEQVELICENAFSFKRYTEFSHIFMFRPLNGELMIKLFNYIFLTFKETKKKFTNY